MKKGVGSVWNQGSWHWEEKNYNKYAQEKLKALFESIKLEEEGIHCEIGKVISMDCEASINIRKQKQIYLFNVSATLSWRAELLEGEEEMATGDITLQEFNQDDVEELEIEIKVTKKNKKIDKIREILKNKMLKTLIEKILEFQKEFNTMGTSPDKEIEHAKEKELYEAAKGLKSEGVPEKKEEEKKTLAEASAWNAAAYHWEEKAISGWAADRFKTLLLQIAFEHEGGKGAVTEISSFSGDASVNIRKGKKIVEYDYQISTLWKYEKDSLKLEGTLDIKEMDSTEDHEPVLEVKLVTEAPEIASLQELIKTKAKAVIATFIQELNTK